MKRDTAIGMLVSCRAKGCCPSQRNSCRPERCLVSCRFRYLFVARWFEPFGLVTDEDMNPNARLQALTVET